MEQRRSPFPNPCAVMTPVIKYLQYIVGAAVLLVLLVQLVRIDAATVDAGSDEPIVPMQSFESQSIPSTVLLELESNPRSSAHSQQQKRTASRKYHRPIWRSTHAHQALPSASTSWTQPLQRPKPRQKYYHRRNRAPVHPSVHALHQAQVRQPRTVFPAGKAKLMNRRHAVPSVNPKKVFPAGSGQIMNRNSYAPSVSGRLHAATPTHPSAGELKSFRSPHVSEAKMRAAGMDTHRGGSGPFDLSGYDAQDIVGSEGIAHAVQTNVDDTIHQAYSTMKDLGLNKHANIPERKWTAPTQTQTQPGKSISMAEVGSSNISPAIHLSNPLHRITGASIASRIPTHVTDTIRTVNNPQTRMAQVREIVRQVQHAREERRKAEKEEQQKSHVAASQALHAVLPRSSTNEHQDTPDDTALSFMPSWKQLLFRQ